jgi:hypothetical protein
MLRHKVLIIIGVSAAVLLAAVITIRLRTHGWDLPPNSEYSILVKKRTIRPSNISEIKFKVACSWDGCQEFSITFRDNGQAEYFGKKNVDRIGKYVGRFEEYGILAGYISSKTLSQISQRCSDTYVSTALNIRGQEVTYRVCDPNQAQPELRDVHAAIEEAASRIHWRKTDDLEDNAKKSP